MHREPEPNWKWNNDDSAFEYKIIEPGEYNQTVALNLSISDTIDNSRIAEILGEKVSVWTLTVPKPDKDLIKSRNQLSEFRKIFRELLGKIKLKHGQKNLLHIFPCAPVSIAIEIGRTWMPKADLPFRIYDQNNKAGGFLYTFDIEYK